MQYNLITILINSNNNVVLKEFSNSKLSYSGDFIIVEEDGIEYSTISVFNLKDINKIRKYKIK